MRKVGILDCFELLHFHLGSQVSNIRNVKNALREASRFYVEVSQAGAPLKYLDVGGGLGVDYDGSQTNFTSSMNYTTEEYANDVVFSVLEACNEARVEHPILVSESGRAVVAHHAVLVTEVLGVSEFDAHGVPESAARGRLAGGAEPAGHLPDLTRKNVLEAYHDATEYKEECLTLFSLGHLTLADAGAGGEPLLGALPEDPAHRARAGRDARGARDAGAPAVRHLLLQLLGVPVAARLLGDRSALPDHADPPAERAAHAPGGAGGHHLRLGREDRALHRPARREGRARAAPAQRGRLLPGHLPGRRVPGDPRRPAQPVRRHPRGAGVAGAERRATSSTTWCPATR